MRLPPTVISITNISAVVLDSHCQNIRYRKAEFGSCLGLPCLELAETIIVTFLFGLCIVASLLSMSTAFLPLNFYADRIASGVDGLIVDESKYVIVEKDSNACVNGGNELSSDEKANLMESSTRNICRWLPQNEESIRGICVIAHGMLEHAQNYHEFACKLAIENKFAVYAMDHVGHGESSGDSGFFDSYELLVDEYIDLHYWIRSTQHNNNNLPCFLFGHSLGSMIVSAACNRIPNVKAVGLSALPLDAGPGAASLFGIRALYPLSQTSVAIPILKFLSSIDPRGSGAPVFLESCTSDPEKLEFAKSDFRR